MAEKAKEKSTNSAATISIITGGKAIKDNMVNIAKDCKLALNKKYNIIDGYPSSFTVKGSIKS